MLLGEEEEELWARESRTLLQESWLANLDEFPVALPQIDVFVLVPNGLSSFTQRSYGWLLIGKGERASLYISLDRIATILRIIHKSSDTIEEHKSSLTKFCLKVY